MRCRSNLQVSSLNLHQVCPIWSQPSSMSICCCCCSSCRCCYCCFAPTPSDWYVPAPPHSFAAPFIYWFPAPSICWFLAATQVVVVVVVVVLLIAPHHWYWCVQLPSFIAPAHSSRTEVVRQVDHLQSYRGASKQPFFAFHQGIKIIWQIYPNGNNTIKEFVMRKRVA